MLAILVRSHLGNILGSLNHICQRVKDKIAFKASYSRFSIFSSGRHFVHGSGTNLAILIEGHLSNISIKRE